METQEEITPKNNAASILFAVLAMLGWLTLLGGLILAAFMVSEAGDLQHLARFMISFPGLGVAFGGLLIIVVAKIGDAIVDAANNTAETAKITAETVHQLKQLNAFVGSNSPSS